jgi:hypothetical protein
MVGFGVASAFISSSSSLVTLQVWVMPWKQRFFSALVNKRQKGE